MELGAPEDPEFRKPYEEFGAPVRIADGATVSVSVKAIDTAAAR